jgi:hypothetical protein
MTLFIQAFRYAGEPFFFSYAKQRDAKHIYALVLNWFVIFCVFIFLLVTLYIDLFQYFVGSAYREGLRVVPVLLLANLLLGIYVNLSIWYKLTDRTLMGAWVALVGAGITVLSLWLLVPAFGYEGAAWAHLICYGAMVVLSYTLGRRYYPVPYDALKVFGYMGLGLALYAAGRWLTDQVGWNPFAAGTLLLAVYVAVVALLDGRKLLNAGAGVVRSEDDESAGGDVPEVPARPDRAGRRATAPGRYPHAQALARRAAPRPHAGRTPRRQATMRPTAAASTRAPRSTWRPKLRHLDLTLALAAASMAVVSIAFNDAAKAPIYLLLAYLLWRIGRRG